jgi:hypothetical protein
VGLHAAQHGAEAHNHPLEADTVKAAIRLADWFAAQQLELLQQSRATAKIEREKRVFELLVAKSKIKARDAQLAKVAPRAWQVKALLDDMVKSEKLDCRDHRPEGGGHKVRWYWKRAQSA